MRKVCLSRENLWKGANNQYHSKKAFKHPSVFFSIAQLIARE